MLDLSDPWTRFRICTEPHKGHPGAVREPSQEVPAVVMLELAAHEERATYVQGEELFGEEGEVITRLPGMKLVCISCERVLRVIPGHSSKETLVFKSCCDACSEKHRIQL